MLRQNGAAPGHEPQRERETSGIQFLGFALSLPASSRIIGAHLSNITVNEKGAYKINLTSSGRPHGSTDKLRDPKRPHRMARS